jgi:RNA polymerase sigma-70 factor (ECF subfamily)
MCIDDDQVLVKNIRAGKRSSFEDLMKKYNKKIFNFIFRMVRDEDHAIELTQDFFIKIYTVIDKYNFEYKFSTWAYRICYNLVIDFIRKNKTVLQSLDDESVSEKKMLETENYIWEDGCQKMEKDQLKEMIWRVVETISPKYRELILLRYIEELKYEEIADITDLPVGTVKNRIFKAKEILKEELEKDGLFN